MSSFESAFSKLLLAVVLIEVAAGGYLWWKKSVAAKPPTPGLSIVDSITAASLHELIATCETADDWHNLANTYMSAGFFAEANSCYEQALKMKPDWGDAIYNQAFCLSRYGQTELANQKFSQVIQMKHAKAADAYFFMGQNHLRDGDPEKAEDAFLKAAPVRPMAKYELAHIMFRKGRFDDAKELLVDLLSAHPKASRVKLLFAEVLLAQGDSKRADGFRIEGTDVTDRLPTPFVTEKNRLAETITSYGFEQEASSAFGLLDANKVDEAIIELQRLQAIQWSPNIHSVLVDFAIQQKDFEKAERMIQEEIAISGPTSIWLGRLGNVRMMAGNETGAVEAWKLGIEVRNDSAVESCISGVGQHFAIQGKTEEANRYEAMLLIEFARRAIKDGDLEKAISHMTRAIVIAPDSAEAFFLLGKAYVRSAESENAIAALKKCLAIAPSYGDAIRELQLLQ